MGRRAKLEKFAQILSFPNVFENYTHHEPQLVGENGVKVDMNGKWQSEYFKNENDLILELACGKGDYTIALAKANPEKNYIGVDVKGNRIWRGAKTATEEKINNAAFLRTRIEHIGAFFLPGEVSQIWITFPDPFPKASKENRRLTSGGFLDSYKSILKPDGIMHLKTDADTLYEYTTEYLSTRDDIKVLYDNDDIYAKALDFPELDVKTFYEKQHLEKGKTIKYLRFSFLR